MATWCLTSDSTIEISDSGGVRGARLKKPRKVWVSPLGYAMISLRDPATGRYRRQRLHQIIWQTFFGPIPPGKVVDHVNRDPLDNRLSNLRLVTHAGNARNRRKPKGDRASPFLGVRRIRRKHDVRYYARVTYGDDDRCSGRVSSQVDAAALRDMLAITMTGNLFGQSLNFPKRWGLDMPPAHGPLPLQRLSYDFSSGLGFVWVSLERAAIPVSAVEESALIAIDIGGVPYIRCEDAADWHQEHGSQFPDHLEACRLLLRTTGRRGAK